MRIRTGANEADPSAPLAPKWPAVAVFAPIFLLLGLFVAWYVRHEHYIYFWDSVGYQNIYKSLGLIVEINPLGVFQYVLASVRDSDYNVLPVLFLMPFRLAFGAGRLPYVLSIAVIYAFPLLLLFPVLAARVAGDDEPHGALDAAGIQLLAVLALASAPLLWSPILLGLPDVGGLFVLSTILLLYFRADLAQQEWRNLLVLGFLLAFLILFRRWYAYWVLGFFGAMGVCEGLRLAGEKQRRAEFLRLAGNATIIGATAVSSILVIAFPLVKRVLTTDYGDIYSAYRSKQPALHNLAMLYHQFGLLTLLFAGAGVVLSERIPSRRPMVHFLCAQFFITYVIFTRTQDFGFQHFYCVVATLALFVALFARDAFLWIRPRAGKAAFTLAFLFVSVFLFAGAFLPRARAWNAALGPLAPQPLYPRVRTDLQQMSGLLDALSDLSRPPDSSIYILSSSFTLNSSIAREACSLLDPPHRGLAMKISQTNDIDKRDGFPAQMLGARLVVLTVPFGYHLAPRDQRVIGILAEDLVRGEGIGKSYDKLPFEFPLDDGSSAFIYQKARPLDPIAVRQLSDQFLELYPNNPAKFRLSSQTIRSAGAL